MTITDIDKQLMEVVKNNWHSGAGEIIDFDKFLCELNESVHQIYSQAKAEQREELINIIDGRLNLMDACGYGDCDDAVRAELNQLKDDIASEIRGQHD